MRTIDKVLVIFWPGLVALAFSTFCLDGVWQEGMLKAIGIVYTSIAPMIYIAFRQDSEAAKRRKGE